MSDKPLNVPDVELERAPWRPEHLKASPLELAAHALGRDGGPTTAAERALFEAWMRGHCWQCAEWNGKSYADTTTRVLWAAWRDRAALSAPDGVDARRWRWIRNKTRAQRDHPTWQGRFNMPSLRPLVGADIFRGSVAEHLDAAIDAEIAAGTDSKQ